VRVCAGDGGGRDERGAGRTKSASTNTNQLHGPGTRSPSFVFRRQDIQIGSKILFKSLYITYQTGSRCPLQKLPKFLSLFAASIRCHGGWRTFHDGRRVEGVCVFARVSDLVL
jgi:hypothetical protein